MREDPGSHAEPGQHRPAAHGVPCEHQSRPHQPSETGEPDKYYPTGIRNYARVVATDDYQGQGAAQFALDDLEVPARVLGDVSTV